MKHLIKAVAAVAVITFVSAGEVGAREFAHPGLSYSEADIVRMRKAVEEKQEPMLSTFNALKASIWSQTNLGPQSPVDTIHEGKFNNTVGADGRRVHDLALLYRITGDSGYADQAVAILNRYNGLTCCSSRGTAPLDNGKVYLMLEGAELLRDYPGWAEADRRAFADMLVHPGYSDSTFPESAYDGYDDSKNGVTFYWNIYNFDTGRWGNQGLFAARALMAMGIFLDNEKMYDRALRYLLSKPARTDDIPYSKKYPSRGTMRSETEFVQDYNVSWSEGREQYISDEALEYYIYANGQSQESCRDQGHAFVGIGLYTDLAEMAANQGDDLYGALDNRILKGLEYICRYNLGSGDPEGYSTNEADCTFDNNIFYRATSRSKRWTALSPASGDRGNIGAVRFLTQALNHYKGIEDLAKSEYQWLQKAWDEHVDNFEDWGTVAHYYEWKGWGTLTKMPLLPASGLTDAGNFCDKADASVVYYNLQGVKIADADSAGGFLIESKGGSARIILK